MSYYIYILANKIDWKKFEKEFTRNGTLYIGVTNNLIRRIWEHKNKLVERFSSKYDADKLVYYEVAQDQFGNHQRETDESLEKRMEAKLDRER